jgi:signal transduction histidine kinase
VGCVVSRADVPASSVRMISRGGMLSVAEGIDPHSEGRQIAWSALISPVMLLFRRLFPRLSAVGFARVDAVIGLLLLVEIELQVWLGSGIQDRALPTGLGLVVALAVAFRRRWPLPGVFVILAGGVTRTLLGGPVGQQPAGLLPALLLLFYGMGAFSPERRSRWAVLLALVISSINTFARGGQTVSGVVVSALLVALLPYGLGRMMRARAARERSDRERAELVDARRDLKAQTALYEERARIARELHDVIAHSVSVMVIQAGGARMVMSSEPERAEASLRSVERAGRDALAEMRRLLGVLDGKTDPRALAPQPGLADVDELVFRARASGLATDLHVDGEPAAVSPALDLCAYRIVQEALTNAIKYAAPARAEVRVRWKPSALEIEVSDDGRGPGAVNGVSGGHGIPGMRERVALHGGSIHCGAGTSGGFTVRASLPLAPELVR